MQQMAWLSQQEEALQHLQPAEEQRLEAIQGATQAIKLSKRKELYQQINVI